MPGVADCDETPCDDCLATPRPWTKGWAAVAYEGKARSLILRLKHSDRTDLARPAAKWMVDRLKGQLPLDTMVVPIPAHRLRLVQRRYNQAALLAQAVAKDLSLDLCVDGLLRVRATPKLDGKTLVERFATLDGAIRVHPKRARLVRGRPVLVIDDVMTSGATLAAAAQTLTQAGAKEVFVCVLARVLKTP